MHAQYISTNNNYVRLLIILDNIWSRYGLDTPNNYPATLYTKGRLPTLSLECHSDPQFFDRAAFIHAQYSLHSSTQHFHSSLLHSNCRLRITQLYTRSRSSISIP